MRKVWRIKFRNGSLHDSPYIQVKSFEQKTSNLEVTIEKLASVAVFNSILNIVLRSKAHLTIKQEGSTKKVEVLHYVNNCSTLWQCQTIQTKR